MASDSARFLRQVMLPDVGDAGQGRIASAIASVGGAGLAHEVATRYARGAGFAAIEPGQIDVAALAPADLVHDDAARQVLSGSRAALHAIRAALGAGDPG